MTPEEDPTHDELITTMDTGGSDPAVLGKTTKNSGRKKSEGNIRKKGELEDKTSLTAMAGEIGIVTPVMKEKKIIFFKFHIEGMSTVVTKNVGKEADDVEDKVTSKEMYGTGIEVICVGATENPKDRGHTMVLKN